MFMLSTAPAICIADTQMTANSTGEPPALRMPEPKIPSHATSAAAFAPIGWTVEKAVEGDLNRDGRPDLAVILKGRDANCVVPLDGIPETMDTNPRVVLIAFGTNAGFSLQLANSKVIRRIDDPYMDDPLNIEAFTIRQNVLRLGLTYWRSMGGWTTFNSTFSFRWDGKLMRLIGFDRHTTHRNSGETETLSVNFVTGKAWLATGSIEDERDHVGHSQRMPPQNVEALETIGDGLAYVPKHNGNN